MPFDKSQTSLHQLGYLLAEASKNVVFVIGAGLSAPAGIPLWSSLNDALKQFAKECMERVGRPHADIQDRLAKIDAITDPWLLGDELQSLIPQDKYVGFIRSKLTSKMTPPAYQALWGLAPSGVISFNVDDIARTVLDGDVSQCASGNDSSKYQKFLLLTKPFLFQPHGTLRDAKSWVFGTTSRNRLLKSPAYKKFISAVLSSRRLVIAGLRPTDFAIESLLLEDFRDELSRGIEHFWILSNPSVSDREFASKYNILIIEYSASDDSHPEIAQILRYLSEFEPRNPDTVAAYQGQTISIDELLPDHELRTQSVEDIRRRLNAALGSISSAEHSTYMSKLMKFYMDYSGSVHMAWHMKSGAQYGTVWGYRLVKTLGNGAFGNVWQVEDPTDGTQLALKVLHETIIDQPDFIEAFRRGVRAMKILSEAHVPGMVRYRDAFDIPAAVLMELIDGITFHEALTADALDRPVLAVSIVERVARIVYSGHQLDKQVLHRDLKPSNVMLRRLYENLANIDLPLDDKLDVVVLDFDLSWYEGAMGKSLMSGTRFHNYAAPEQLQTRGRSDLTARKYSSRHTAVDVYGIGMLLYFSMTKVDPSLNIQNTGDFIAQTVRKINKAWSLPFLGLSLYIAILISEATYDAQERRIGMAAMIEQLSLIRSVLQTSTLPASSDLCILAIASVVASEGIWALQMPNHSLSVLSRLKLESLPATIEISFEDAGNPDDSRLSVVISFASTGNMPFGNVSKYLRSRGETASALLSKNNLFEARYSVANQLLTVTATAKARNWSASECQQIGQAISDAGKKVAFTEN